MPLVKTEASPPPIPLDDIKSDELYKPAHFEYMESAASRNCDGASYPFDMLEK